MKAVQINNYGGLEVLEINENSEKPSAGKDQVLVEVYAASINPIDYKLREGYLKSNVPLKFPVTLGGDFSGKVSQIGDRVSNFKVGDEVYGQAGILNGGSGSMAEFVRAFVGKISSKPKNINFEETAAMPLAGISALQAIEDHIKLQKGPTSAKATAGKQKILIHGGAGGIGSYAIQIARVHGAHVATTVSANDIEYVKNLGADEVIDYKTQDFSTILKEYDAVFDTVGGDTTDKSFTVLKKGGVIVSMLGQPSPELAEKNGVTAIGQGTDASPDRLKRLTELIESGKVKPNIDKIFLIDQVREAFEYQEKQSPKGKVVIKIK